MNIRIQAESVADEAGRIASLISVLRDAEEYHEASGGFENVGGALFILERCMNANLTAMKELQQTIDMRLSRKSEGAT